MAQNAEYKIIQYGNAHQVGAELAVLATQGWKPILLSTVHAVVGPAGGNVVVTVILEHVLGT